MCTPINLVRTRYSFFLQPDQRTKIIAQAQETITNFGMKLVNQRKEEHAIGKLNRLDLLSLLSQSPLPSYRFVVWK